MPRYTPKNIAAYLTGKLRYAAYYSKNFKWLIRRHIKEQIVFRIEMMDKQCYDEGQCTMCGCQTTALQMANKVCDRPCYPPMMDKVSWLFFYTLEERVYIKKVCWFLVKKDLETQLWTGLVVPTEDRLGFSVKSKMVYSKII